MKAIDLINKALILSGIVSAELQQPTDSQGTNGLFWLNQSLISNNASGIRIPYYREYIFNMVPNQETYFIPDLIKSDCITFNLDAVRFSMYSQDRRTYQGSSRIDNINAFPQYYYEERVNGGCNESFYFLPQQNFKCTITGRFGFTGNINSFDELDLILDKYYQLYLMYDVAILLCNFYKSPVPAMTQQKWDEYKTDINNINIIDFTTKIVSVFRPGTSLNIGQANVSNGYWPS